MSGGAHPWYDSHWLAAYHATRDWLARNRPDKGALFEALVAPLRTDPAFRARVLPGVIDASQLQEIRDVVRGLAATDLELHEARRFGRFVVHDHPPFVRLQASLAPLVSATCGEEVDPCYSFLSLYTGKGVCELHMDAPYAKWTLDLCIDSNVDWPIWFSRVVPWPGPEEARAPDWRERLRADETLGFTRFSLLPGEAILFGGSSQWHVRDPIPPAPDGSAPYCTLLFLHYVPRAAGSAVDLGEWPALLGEPGLAPVIAPHDVSPRLG